MNPNDVLWVELRFARRAVPGGVKGMRRGIEEKGRWRGQGAVLYLKRTLDFLSIPENPP